jgi:hypothetical protein
MLSAAIGLFLVLLATEPVATPLCNVKRLVAVGSGCLEVPCQYRAIMSRPGIDGIGGVFDSTRTETKVYWYEYDAGFWFFLHTPDEVVWRRPAVHGWHLWWHELVEQGGQRAYVVTDGNFSLVADNSGPSALSQLVQLASSYRTKRKTDKCENPEPWQP